jgi:hypothetical protein
MFLPAVAALLASNPALASTPSKPVVSSKDNPKALATGAIVLIALLRYSKDKAEAEQPLESTSATF